MLTKETKLEILREILSSPDFKDSKRYQELLTYLVEQTLSGETPKELTIGIQFFERGNQFDPKEDTTVRVYLNNLRKKLEHHYLTCNNPYGYKLIIPKGHYQVEFQEIEALPTPLPLKPEIKISPFRKFKYPLLFLLLFSAGFLLSYVIFNDTAKSDIVSPVWKEFITPGGRPTLVLLGDYFFLFERPQEGQQLGRFIRDLRINSQEDYNKIIRSNPEFAKNFIQGNFTYLRPSSSWGLSYILPVLQNSPNGYSLKLASQFTIDDAKTHNIVYLGSFKNLYNLQKILHIFNIEYSLSPAGFHFNDDDSTMFFSPGDFKGGNYENDYAVTAKAKGPEGSTIMLLMGFAETGIIEAAKSVSSPELYKNYFSKEQAKNAPYFTAVIETEGINQSIFKTHIRYFTAKDSKLK